MALGSILRGLENLFLRKRRTFDFLSKLYLPLLYFESLTFLTNGPKGKIYDTVYVLSITFVAVLFYIVINITDFAFTATSGPDVIAGPLLLPHIEP